MVYLNRIKTQMLHICTCLKLQMCLNDDSVKMNNVFGAWNPWRLESIFPLHQETKVKWQWTGILVGFPNNQGQGTKSKSTDLENILFQISRPSLFNMYPPATND